MTVKHITRLESIQETIDRCEYLSEGLCMHCNDKADLISIACAWAFELGVEQGKRYWAGLFWEQK